MTSPSNRSPSDHSLMPHRRLRAHGVAVEFLLAVKAAELRDRTLREQALKSAKSACANTAEGAGRSLQGEKRRAYGIARGETVEAVALVEIALAVGEAKREHGQRAVELGNQLYAMLSRLVR